MLYFDHTKATTDSVLWLIFCHFDLSPTCHPTSSDLRPTLVRPQFNPVRPQSNLTVQPRPISNANLFDPSNAPCESPKLIFIHAGVRLSIVIWRFVWQKIQLDIWPFIHQSMNIHPWIYGHSSVHAPIHPSINHQFHHSQPPTGGTIDHRRWFPSLPISKICLYACKCVSEQGDGEVKLTLNGRRKGESN